MLGRKISDRSNSKYGILKVGACLVCLGNNNVAGAERMGREVGKTWRDKGREIMEHLVGCGKE